MIVVGAVVVVTGLVFLYIDREVCRPDNVGSRVLIMNFSLSLPAWETCIDVCI